MTLNKDAPWWAKLTANSALILIALGAIWTLRQDVQAKLDRLWLSLDGHVNEERMSHQRQMQLQRAQCLNEADTWVKMQNCIAPAEAVWPREVGDQYEPTEPEVSAPRKRPRSNPTFGGISVN